MDWTVIKGDSRTAIPDEEFALVVTSPPYNVGLEYDGHEDTMSVAGWRALIKTVLGEAWDRLVEGGRLCVNVQHGVGRSPMIPLAFHVEGIGHELPEAQYRGAVVWHKGATNVTSWGSWRSPSNPVLRGTYEMVFVWSKGTMGREGGEGDLSSGAFMEATLDTWHIAAEQSRGEHPAPFPVALAERLIRLYSWPGDSVLDPFCGVGSSGVAAKHASRSWVGVDVSETYCEIARDRIAKAEPVTGNGLSEEMEAFAHELVETLGAGAQAGGLLEVHRFTLVNEYRWERYRQSLVNQIGEVGAYGVVRKQDGSRVVWTTSQGRAAMLTLRRWSRGPVRTIRAASVGELEAELIADAVKVLKDAVPDKRMRSVTARGY